MKKKPKPAQEPALPKFGGFQQLAGGLAEMKAKLAAEETKRQEELKQAGKKPAPPPAPRAPLPKVTPASAAEDELSFHRMMAGVTPLDGGPARVGKSVDAGEAKKARPKAEELRAQAKTEAEAVRDHLRHLVDDVARFEVTDDGRRVEGRRSDVTPDVVRTLRRGLMPIDARIDLHGLRAEDARDKLVAFLRDKRQNGERCVLVIHGKGDSVPGAGVLRGEIAAWLSQGAARAHVAAFATARDDDGGEGAVYVALRR